MTIGESYAQFLERIGKFETPVMPEGPVCLAPDLGDKVLENGSFRPFFGDTLVFDLAPEDKKKIASLIDKLYDTAPECFAERLRTSTLHMTLHDLCASTDPDPIQKTMEQNDRKLREMGRIKDLSFTMESTCVFSMVGKSLVLGLKAADEQSHELLWRLYDIGDRLVTLNYKFTPHITLAYFTPQGFPEEKGEELKALLMDLEKEKLTLTFTAQQLCYQRFYSMNQYDTRYRLRPRLTGRFEGDSVKTATFVDELRGISREIIVNRWIQSFPGIDEEDYEIFCHDCVERTNPYLEGPPIDACVRFGADFGRLPDDSGYYMTWCIQPDGRYYEDEDGFGAERQDEISLYALLDEEGRFTTKFRLRDVGVEEYWSPLDG